MELLKLSSDVNECKPLPTLSRMMAATAGSSISDSSSGLAVYARMMASSSQGLKLVHFSAQLEPGLPQENTLNTT
jgi:hypothetical protein